LVVSKNKGAKMDRKERILEAAYEHFSKNGYNASLSNIAKDAGIKKPTLYNYFANKDDLLFEMLTIEIHKYFSNRLNEFEAYESKTIEARLKNLFFTIIEYFKDKKAIKFWRWIIFIDSDELKEKARNIIKNEEKDFLYLLINVFEEGVTNGEIKDQPIRPLIHTYIALIHGTLDGVLLYDQLLDLEAFSENVWNTFWEGISKKN